MRVGVLTAEEFDGFGYVARKTAELLRLRGHEVFLIDTFQVGKRETSLQGVPLYFILRKKPKLGLLEELIITRNFINKNRLDSIISISAWIGKWSYYFKQVSPKLKSLIWFQDVRTDDDWRKIFTIPFYWLESGRKDFSSLILHERYNRFLRKKGIHKADGLITQAELICDKVKKLYDIESVKIVSNPVPIPEQNQIKKGRDPSVVFLGRLDVVKRPWLFGEIAKCFPNIRFLVLGTSQFPETTNGLINQYRSLKNLTFLGYVDGKKKAEILSRAWILVNTSVYESLPVSFLEALAYKMAILSCQNPDNLASNYGVYTGEILGNGMSGIPRFVKGLKYLLSNDEWARKGEMGYMFVKSFAEEGKIAEELEKILISL